MSTGKLVVGVLACVAVGALLGVLFAPEKGSETRKKISKKSSDTLDELKDKFDEMVSSITDKFEGAKDQASNMVEKGRFKVDELRKDGKSAVS